MKLRLLLLFVVYLSAGCGIAPPNRAVEAANSPFPSRVSATMDEVLAKARKTWQADAIVTTVEMQWYPQDEPDETKVQHWLAITLNSPSKGARRYVYVGGPYAGQIVDMPPDKDSSTIDHALPDFKFDLPQAIEFIRHAGLKDRLFFVKLEMVRAAGTPPIAAWIIASLSDRRLYPITDRCADRCDHSVEARFQSSALHRCANAGGMGPGSKSESTAKIKCEPASRLVYGGCGIWLLRELDWNA